MPQIYIRLSCHVPVLMNKVYRQLYQRGDIHSIIEKKIFCLIGAVSINLERESL